MKFLKRMMQKLTLLDKLSLAIAAAFIVISAAYFFVSNSGWLCPICKQELVPGEDYLWDARTGDLLALSSYLEREHDVLWFAGKYDLPQEVSVTQQRGYARFFDNPTGFVTYCPEHRALRTGSQEFYILSERKAFTMSYPIPDEGTVTPGGHAVWKQYNGGLEAWELVIQW